MLAALTSKTARLALTYVLLCAALLVWSNRARFALTGEWRHAALRELELSGPDADVLFLGSSRTARGLIPREFEARWREVTGGETTSLNLAIMGIPRNIMFDELTSWLRNHPPPAVVFCELGEPDLYEWPHKLLDDFVLPVDALRIAAARPYAYRDSRHYVRENPSPSAREERLFYFDPGGFFNAFEVVQLNVDIGLRALGRGPEDVVRIVHNRVKNGRAGRGWDNPYWREVEIPEIPEILPAVTAQQVEAGGWYLIAPTSRDGALGKEKVEVQAGRNPVPWVRTDDVAFDDPGRYRVARRYARELAQLCSAHGIRLVFMELPGFRQRASDSQIGFHERIAEVFRPDPDALQTVLNYQDPGHFSIEGGKLYSRWLAEWLVEHP